MALPIVSYAQEKQEKMYLVKGNRLVATYDVEDVDYITFDLDPSIVTSDFQIELDDISYTSATWTVTPADPDMLYYTGVYTPKLFDELGGDVEGLASKLASDMRFLASMAQMNFETFMENEVLYKGECWVGYDQMGPDTEYYIVAFGCNPDGTPSTSEVTKITVHTPAIPMTGLSVEFNVEVDGSDAIITSTPSDPSISYFMQVDPVGEDPVDPQARINQLIWRGGFLDKTPEEVVAENLVSGTLTNKYSLSPNTNYVVYAVSLTPEGVVNSEVSQAEFTTNEVLVSDNTFEVELTDIVSTVATAKITPSNDDMYSIAVIPVSDFEGKTDKEVMEEYQQNWTNKAATDWFRGTGERTLVWDGLTADTEYYFCVFGYYQEVITTGLTKIKFKTPEPSDPKLWRCEYKDFHIDYGRWAMITIDVNEQDVPYVWNVVDSDATVEQIKAYYESEYARVADKGMSIADYVNSRSVTGTNEVSFSGMEDGELYKFFAVVLNPETGDFDTEVFFSETFSKEGYGVTKPADSKKKVAASGQLKIYIQEEK